jgi:DNA-binding LytR/AlgR family response regulator
MWWGSIMSGRAIQDAKAIAPETFVQPPFQGNEVAPPCAHPGNMVTTMKMRSKVVGSEINKRARLATTVRTSSPADELFVDDDTQAKSNVVREVARIAIKAKGRVLFVDPIEVVVAKAQGNYVALVHKTGCYLVRETMATAEQKLTPLGFVRIHRSILVNTNLVKDLRRDNTGTWVLRTNDGNEHPVGRAYKDNLKMIARSWLGVELV